MSTASASAAYNAGYRAYVENLPFTDPVFGTDNDDFWAGYSDAEYDAEQTQGNEV